MSAPHRTRWGKYSLTLVDVDGRTPVAAGLSDPKLARLLDGCTGGVQVRWRFDGTGRSCTVDIGAGVDELLELCRTLRRARAEDWDCDGNRPVPPVASPAPVTPATTTERTPAGADGGEASAATSNVVPLHRPARPVPAAVPDEQPAGTGGLLRIGERRFAGLDAEPELLATFDNLATFFRDEQAATTAKNKSTKRLANTLGGINDQIGFAAAYFRERTVDGHPGASRDLQGPAAITEGDCIDLLATREVTNLRIRCANERRLRDWAARVARVTPGLLVPPAPVPVPEVARASTVKAMAIQVSAAFELAVVEGRLERSPWTARVARRVAAPPPTHFSERHLPPLDAVSAVIDTLARLERTVEIDGKRCAAHGDRYRMFATLLEELHPRPEEVIALRLSDLDHLADDDPYLVFREAMVQVTLALSPTSDTLVAVPLKARSVGDERPVSVSRDFARAMLEHCDRYVPDPDPTSPDRNACDPLVFTTHDGAPIRLGHFREHWWVLAVDATAGEHPAVAGLQLRMLRHIGISRRIQAGDSIERIATDAGNSPEVIHRHYRGIIAGAERINAGHSPAAPATSVTGDLAGALAVLADAPIEDLLDRVEQLPEDARDRMRKRSGAVKGLLS